MRRVFWLTKAGLFVWRKLHKMRTGAGRGAVVIDETQMWTGTTSIILFTRVRGWLEGRKEREHFRTLSIRTWHGEQRGWQHDITGLSDCATERKHMVWNWQEKILLKTAIMIFSCHVKAKRRFRGSLFKCKDKILVFRKVIPPLTDLHSSSANTWISDCCLGSKEVKNTW